MTMTNSRRAVLLAVLAVLGPTAFAQEDNAGQTSGYDPNAHPALKTQTVETPIVIEKQADKLVGIGYGQTPGGVQGVTLEYYLGGTLMLNGMLGLSLISPKGSDSETVFNLAAAAFYRWKNWDNVSLMLGGRLDVAHVSAPGPADKLPQYIGSGDATQLNIELPARAQLYFAHYLAVYAEVAVVVSIVGDGGTVLQPTSQVSSRGKGVYVDIPLSNLIGSFGATFYFP
jgi:hypothetical protein